MTGVSHAGGPRGHEVPASDVLVFARDRDVFRITGGTGRGASWAGIVEARLADEPLLDQAWRSGLPTRIRSDGPSRIAGPYWSPSAAIVPVGHEHLVVFGATDEIRASDATLVGAAASAVAGAGGASAEKLLADELELVHALRSLMDHRPERLADTARHIASVAAQALSCEYATAAVHHGEAVLAVGVELRDGVVASDPAWLDAGQLAVLERSSAGGPVLEQAVSDGVPAQEPASTAVVARLTVPIGRSNPIGFLAVGHAASNPRGFTLLCQRIGRAIGDAAELLISQAAARETLAAERDALYRLSRTDPLTGLANRVAWAEAIEMPGPAGGAVVSADLDGLKRVNDRLGHPVGDLLIKAAANLLLSSAREDDLVARLGGDEFLVLLRGADHHGAQRFIRRVRRAMAVWRITEHRLEPRLSLGAATLDEAGSWEQAVHIADRRMYEGRRRRRSAGQDQDERPLAARRAWDGARDRRRRA